MKWIEKNFSLLVIAHVAFVIGFILLLLIQELPTAALAGLVFMFLVYVVAVTVTLLTLRRHFKEEYDRLDKLRGKLVYEARTDFNIPMGVVVGVDEDEGIGVVVSGVIGIEKMPSSPHYIQSRRH